MALGEPLKNASELQNCAASDLMARCIYAEARGESKKGKTAVAHILRNRIYHSRFPSSYKEVILQSGQFAGMSTQSALTPDLSSAAWAECVDVTTNYGTYTNDIGQCLWFNTNSLYQSVVNANGGKYKFAGGSPVTVVEKVVIGNHTFFRVEGY